MEWDAGGSTAGPGDIITERPSAKFPFAGDGAIDPGWVPQYTFRAGAAVSWGEKIWVLESNRPSNSRESSRTGAEALGLRFHAEPCLGQAPSPPAAGQEGAELAPSLQPLLLRSLPTTAHVPRAASSAFPWHIQGPLANSKSLIWRLHGLPKPSVRDQRSCGFSTE